MKRSTIIGWMLLLAVVSAHAQVKVESVLDSTKILIGEQAHLRLSVTAKENAHVEFPLYEPQQEMMPGIEVVETQGDTLNSSSDTKTYRRTYTLTSWDERKYNIPAQKVKVDGKEYTTNSIPLEVLTVEVDTLHPEQIKPAKDVMDNPFSWNDWLPLAGWLVVALLLCALMGYLYRRLRDNKPILASIRFVKKLLPHQKAMQEIEQIKAEQLSHAEDQKTYYTKLTDTLRQYLEERFGIKAMEMTSSEIIDRLQQEEDASKIAELREVFATADLVKFAKYSTQANERDMYLEHVVRFIDDTKQETVQEEEKTSRISDEDKRSMRSRRAIQVAIGCIGVAVAAILAYVGWQVYLLLI